MAVTEPSSSRVPTGARARSREATRERLLESGLSLFASEGLHNVTTHDIARGAGVAAGTFYLHFKDKRSLFAELARGAAAALRDRLSKAVAEAPSDDPGASVRRHAEAMLEFADDHRELIHILFSGDTDAAAVGADILNELARSLQAARQEHDLVPKGCCPPVLSQAIVGMFARVVAWWADGPPGVTRDEVIDTLVHIQLEGTRPAQIQT